MGDWPQADWKKKLEGVSRETDFPDFDDMTIKDALEILETIVGPAESNKYKATEDMLNLLSGIDEITNDRMTRVRDTYPINPLEAQLCLMFGFPMESSSAVKLTFRAWCEAKMEMLEEYEKREHSDASKDALKKARLQIFALMAINLGYELRKIEERRERDQESDQSVRGTTEDSGVPSAEGDQRPAAEEDREQP